MESTRDIRRMIDKEIKKGSAPMAFEYIDYRPDALQEITSESKLKEVLVYLLRIAEYENLANDMTRNNVYTENHLLRGDSFHRRNNVMERNANYLNAITYAKRLKPVYEGKTFVETVPCFFSFPEAELDRYRFVYEGTETYAFPMSGKREARNRSDNADNTCEYHFITCPKPGQIPFLQIYEPRCHLHSSYSDNAYNGKHFDKSAAAAGINSQYSRRSELHGIQAEPCRNHAGNVRYGGIYDSAIFIQISGIPFSGKQYDRCYKRQYAYNKTCWYRNISDYHSYSGCVFFIYNAKSTRKCTSASEKR